MSKTNYIFEVEVFTDGQKHQPDVITYTTTADVSRAVDEAIDKVVSDDDVEMVRINIDKSSAGEMAGRMLDGLHISPMVEMSEWTPDDFDYFGEQMHDRCEDAALRLMAEADADVKAILMGGAD